MIFLLNANIEVTDLGRSTAGVKFGKKCKAGYFKHRTTFFGLYDYGYEEVCKTKDGREILNVSSEDFHEINGKMGLIVQRSPEDPRVLVPINKCKLDNGQNLNNYAIHLKAHVASVQELGAGTKALTAQVAELAQVVKELKGGVNQK